MTDDDLIDALKLSADGWRKRAEDAEAVLTEIAALIVAPATGEILTLVVFDPAAKDAFVEKVRIAVNLARKAIARADGGEGKG